MKEEDNRHSALRIRKSIKLKKNLKTSHGIRRNGHEKAQTAIGKEKVREKGGIFEKTGRKNHGGWIA